MKNFFIKKFQATLSLAIQLILRYPQISQKMALLHKHPDSR